MKVWKYHLSSDVTGINTVVMHMYRFMYAHLDTYICVFMPVLYIHMYVGEQYWVIQSNFSLEATRRKARQLPVELKGTETAELLEIFQSSAD